MSAGALPGNELDRDAVWTRVAERTRRLYVFPSGVPVVQRQPHEVLLRAPRQRLVGAALVGGFGAVLLAVFWFWLRIALRFQPLPWVWETLLISGILGVWLFALALAVVFRCSRIQVPIDSSADVTIRYADWLRTTILSVPAQCLRVRLTVENDHWLTAPKAFPVLSLVRKDAPLPPVRITFARDRAELLGIYNTLASLLGGEDRNGTKLSLPDGQRRRVPAPACREMPVPDAEGAMQRRGNYSQGDGGPGRAAGNRHPQPARTTMLRECLWTFAVASPFVLYAALTTLLDGWPRFIAMISPFTIYLLVLEARDARDAQRAKRNQDSLLWLWIGGLLLMTPLLALFEGHALSAACRQVRARQYPTTRGAVIESRVDFEAGGSASAWYLRVRYDYHVGGVRLTGTRYRYGVTHHGFARPDPLREIVGSLPAGKPVIVHYNPDDPADALLKPGIDGFDLFSFLFLTPFNLMWIFCCVALARTWRADRGGDGGDQETAASEDREREEAARHIQEWWRLLEHETGLEGELVEPPDQAATEPQAPQPGFTMAVVLAVLCIPTTIGLGFLYGGYPPLSVMIGVWCAVVAVSAAWAICIWSWDKDAGREVPDAGIGGGIE